MISWSHQRTWQRMAWSYGPFPIQTALPMAPCTHQIHHIIRDRLEVVFQVGHMRVDLVTKQNLEQTKKTGWTHSEGMIFTEHEDDKTPRNIRAWHQSCSPADSTSHRTRWPYCSGPTKCKRKNDPCRLHLKAFERPHGPRPFQTCCGHHTLCSASFQCFDPESPQTSTVISQHRLR